MNHLQMKQNLRSCDDNKILSDDKFADYQALVGLLNCVIIVTRPDLSYTVSHLAKFMSKSTKIHLKAVKQTLQYLADIKDINLIYEERLSNANLHNYMNSNFVTDDDNIYSTSDFLFKLNETCIH